MARGKKEKVTERVPSNAQNRPVRNAPAGRTRMKKVVWRIGVLIAALLSALLTLPMLALGLGVAMPVVSLLMLIITALFAGISASWFGTLLAPDNTRTRLLPVVGICEAIAIVLAILVSALSALMDVFIVIPVGVIIVALSASWATWHFRNARTRMGWTARLKLALAVAMFAVSYELLSTGFIGSSSLGLLFYLPIDLLSYIDPLYFVVGASVASVALSVILAMWRLQRRADQLETDAAITLGLVGLAPLIFIGTLYIAELYGLVGA